MTHAVRGKKRLTHRVARIRGQVDALSRAIEGGAECGDVLRLIASARGAMDSLMAQVLEGHIKEHVFPRGSTKADARRAAADLLGIIRSYLT
jgi:DNA-binding FrmR family transcriptional regulator